MRGGGGGGESVLLLEEFLRHRKKTPTFAKGLREKKACKTGEVGSLGGNFLGSLGGVGTSIFLSEEECLNRMRFVKDQLSFLLCRASREGDESVKVEHASF